VNAVEAAKRLDEFNTLRGNIAHRTKHHQSVHKRKVKKFLDHVERLARLTEDRVRQHLKASTARDPW
jgi:hypothetical protein